MTAYRVTLKNTPRARKVHTWVRFGESASHVAHQLRLDTRRDLPELVILSVVPTADPRGAKVRALAEAAARLEHLPRRPMIKCDRLSPFDKS
jgi:hypothetical protein